MMAPLLLVWNPSCATCLLGNLQHLFFFFWPVKASTFSSINLWETKVPKTLQVRFEGYMGQII